MECQDNDLMYTAVMPAMLFLERLAPFQVLKDHLHLQFKIIVMHKDGKDNKNSDWYGETK